MINEEILKQYEILKDETRRFTHWQNMDAFVKNLAEQIAPPIKKQEMERFQMYTFDKDGNKIELRYE